MKIIKRLNVAILIFWLGILNGYTDYTNIEDCTKFIVVVGLLVISICLNFKRKL